MQIRPIRTKADHRAALKIRVGSHESPLMTHLHTMFCMTDLVASVPHTGSW